MEIWAKLIAYKFALFVMHIYINRNTWGKTDKYSVLYILWFYYSDTNCEQCCLFFIR